MYICVYDVRLDGMYGCLFGTFRTLIVTVNHNIDDQEIDIVNESVVLEPASESLIQALNLFTPMVDPSRGFSMRA